MSTSSSHDNTLVNKVLDNLSAELLSLGLKRFDISNQTAESSSSSSSSSLSSNTSDKTQPTRNLSMFAEQSFEVGQALIRSMPYMTVMSTEARGCSWCFRPVEKMSRCTACKKVLYCSKSHQRKHWKFCHKEECKSLKPDGDNPLDYLKPNEFSSALMLSRVLRRYARQKEERENADAADEECSFGSFIVKPDDMKSLEPNNYSSGRGLFEQVQALTSHQDDFQKHFPNAKRRLVDDIFDSGLVSRSGVPEQDEKLATRLLCIFQCNNFTITDDLLLPVGEGLYPIGALFNHSCQPNCVITYEYLDPPSPFPIQVIRALRPIQLGEELTISYVDSMSTHSSRRDRLFQNYLFKCTCRRCQNTDPERLDVLLEADRDEKLLNGQDAKVDIAKIDFKRRLQIAEDMERRAKNMKSTSPDSLALLENCDQIRCELLHPLNLQRFISTRLCYESSLAQQDFEKAARYLQRICDSYRCIYCENHPMLGLHLYTLGTLQVNINKQQTALSSLQEAYRILTITHGPRNALVEQLSETIKSI